MRQKILFVDAIIRYKKRNKIVEEECNSVVIKENDTHLNNIMCKQCEVKEAEIVSYKVVKELGLTNEY